RRVGPLPGNARAKLRRLPRVDSPAPAGQWLAEDRRRAGLVGGRLGRRGGLVLHLGEHVLDRGPFAGALRVGERDALGRELAALLADELVDVHDDLEHLLLLLEVLVL